MEQSPSSRGDTQLTGDLNIHVTTNAEAGNPFRKEIDRQQLALQSIQLKRMDAQRLQRQALNYHNAAIGCGTVTLFAGAALAIYMGRAYACSIIGWTVFIALGCI